MTKAPYPATSMPDPDWWAALWPDPGAVCAALGLGAGLDLVVDLCCGDGLFTPALARLARRVLALDLDPVLLMRAHRRLAAASIANCALVEGDAEEIAALLPVAADAMLIANTFHGVPDKPRLARAVAARLRPGGLFAIVNWHRRPRAETVVLGRPRGPADALRMSPEEVAAAVAPAGLAPLRIVELPPYHYGAVFAKEFGSGA